MAVAAPAAHRLALTAAEFALLARACGGDLPPGFAPAPVAETALRAAASTLAERGVVVANSTDPLDGEPVPSVAANLALVTAPVAGVAVQVGVHGRGLRAFYGISGALGASLFSLAEGAVELSMFPAVSLGQELIRAVPTAEQLGSARRPVRVALDRSVDRSLTGRLPLAALAECDETRPFTAAAESEVAPGLRLTAEERSLAERVAQRTTGTLWCLVTGRDPDGVLVGQVVWLATDVGWIGLRPDPDGTGRELVALQAVARDDIGGWLAPYVAEILEVTDERS